MNDVITIGKILHGFFADYLPVQRGLRSASLKSYKDTLKLFLLYLAAAAGKKIVRLTIEDLTCEKVIAFLNSLEKIRANSVRTRNQRLAALRTFCKYAANSNPEALLELEKITAIPTKRWQLPQTVFLQREEIHALFKTLPVKGQLALRDRTLILFLYNTGARVQEVADLRLENLDLSDQPRVRLHGKGDKWRTCPLWGQTAMSLKQLIEEYNVQAGEPIFKSKTKRALTRFGIYKIVRRLTANLAPSMISGHSLKISPHVFRHTAAVHLLDSGVDVNVIRAWLGHANLDTTNQYAEITASLKARALAVCEPPVGADFHRNAKWRDDQTLLK